MSDSGRQIINQVIHLIFDLVELDGRELVSMEYVDGTTLASMLHQRSPLDLEEARNIATQFLGGLEAIHAAGLVHRDLKPENLMITRAGRVVVMDFGIAKALEEAARGTVAGTPAYMAPEQARGERLDARADLFSAAVVLAEMIAPDGVRTADARRAFWQAAQSDPPQLGDGPWAEILRRTLARDRERRPAGAAELARALEEVALRVLEELKPGRNLKTNVEFYTALVLHGIGLEQSTCSPRPSPSGVSAGGRRTCSSRCATIA